VWSGGKLKLHQLGCELSILPPPPSKVDAREKIRIGGSIDCCKALWMTGYIENKHTHVASCYNPVGCHHVYFIYCLSGVKFYEILA
jgi:hypothetical protein